VELMTITLDQARTKLTGSPWSPVELIGEGGGGAVFLCARTSIGQDLDAYGSLLMNTTANHLGSGRFGPQPADPKAVIPGLVGRLLLAAHTRSGIAAVKIPHVPATGGAEDLRFQREIQAMKQHKHPALIRLFDTDARTPPTWFAVEYHSRGDLQQEVNREKYIGNPLAVLEDIRPIADGLGMLHRSGFVHRDVKPKNVFVADDGHLVLGDFGIVLPGEDVTRITGAEIHSRDWVPDWVRFGDLPTYTKVVDVFMLAKVIYFLVSGGDNVMASQAERAFSALLTKFPNARGLEATLSLLRKCIVLQEEECTISDGAALAAEIDRLLAAETIDPRARLLFSFLSMSLSTGQPLSQNRVLSENQPLPPIQGLSGLQVFVSPSACEFVARARSFGQNSVLEYRIGNATSKRVALPATGGSHPGTWSDPIHLRATKGVPVGWQELSVGGAGPSDISGFMLYAL